MIIVANLQPISYRASVGFRKHFTIPVFRLSQGICASNSNFAET